MPQHISGKHACAGRDLGDKRGVGVDRQQLADRSYEMRCDHRHHPMTFESGFASDRDVAGREVSQTAMDEFAAPSAGSEGQVMRLHQHHRQPAGGCIECRAGPGDTPTDDQYVDRIGARSELREFAGAAVGVQRRAGKRQGSAGHGSLLR